VSLAPDERVAVADVSPLASLRPNFWLLGVGSCVTAAISFSALPWPLALASSLLAILMIAGADVDARTFLLPDAVTLGGVILGIAILPWAEATTGSGAYWTNLIEAVSQAGALGLLFAGLWAVFWWLRGFEGLGFGDVKLAAAVGAWLPLQAIPACFLLATTAALLIALFHRSTDATPQKLPFGAFLCPALWLFFFASALMR
jgi:leader peptidase (prepilin peptidase) / N-methyltransferase